MLQGLGLTSLDNVIERGVAPLKSLRTQYQNELTRLRERHRATLTDAALSAKKLPKEVLALKAECDVAVSALTYRKVQCLFVCMGMAPCSGPLACVVSQGHRVN